MPGAAIEQNRADLEARRSGFSQRSARRALGPVFYDTRPIEELDALICSWLSGDRSETFSAGYVNPHVFNLAWSSPSVRQFLENCDLVAVDGLGVALAAFLLNRHFQPRTVMTPLFDRVLDHSDFPNAKAILIGGSDDVVFAGAAAINRVSSRLQVAATCDGFQPIERYLQLIATVQDCSVVLVAMGSPKSEELILAASRRLPGRFYWNIGGGTLHFHAGTQPRVPRAVSAAGLQWLWRIVHEPRIAHRYAFGIPLFVFRLLRLALNPKGPNPPTPRLI